MYCFPPGAQILTSPPRRARAFPPTMADTSTPSATVPYGDDDEEYEEDEDFDEEYRQPDDEYRQLDVFLEHVHLVSACFLATLDSVRMEPTRKRRFRHVRRVPSVALPTRQYWSSVWGRMLMEMAQSSPNCSTSKLFRRRFRVPYIIFQSILELIRQQEWYHDEQFDVCKQPLPGVSNFRATSSTRSR